MPNGSLHSYRHSLCQQGFSYIGIMVTLVIAAIGLQGAAVMWQQQTQRSHEALLLEVGEAYRLAIGRYYESSPQPVKQYPLSLQELVEDKRFPVLRRHLRKLYHDPFFRKQEMLTLIRDGRIIGVRSQSRLSPVRRSGFQASQEGFSNAKHYHEWQFIYEPNTLAELEQAWLTQ